MPIVQFSDMPASARVWAFGADRSLSADEERRLLGEVDDFLAGWAAHGLPLTCARDWRAGRFLLIAVDQSDAHASGCSIDGLFRGLQRLEQELALKIVGGGRVFWRDRDGEIRTAQRTEIGARIESGELGSDARVFDLGVTSKSDLDDRFERPAGESWLAGRLTAVG